MQNQIMNPGTMISNASKSQKNIQYTPKQIKKEPLGDLLMVSS